MAIAAVIAGGFMVTDAGGVASFKPDRKQMDAGEEHPLDQGWN